MKAALLAFLPAAIGVVALPVAIGAATVDCTTPAIPTSAIGVAQGVAQTAATVVADAQAVWPLVYAAIPADKQAAAQKAFNEAVFTANHAILALDDAIAAAIAANTPNPDFTAIFGQLSDAVGQVVAIVGQFTSPSVQPAVRTPGGVDALADMQAALARLKAAAAKK